MSDDDVMPPGDSPAGLALIEKEADRISGGAVEIVKGGGPLRELPLSDVWNGKLFAHQWGATTRYNHEKKEWVVFSGGRWQMDNTGEVDRRCKESIETLKTEGLQFECGKKRRDLNEHYGKCLQGKTIEEMKRRARSEIPCTSDQFDADPMLLSVLNGTLDLNAGELREPTPEDMIMRQAPVTFDPLAFPERWLPAVDLWMAGDRAMIAYLRRIAGLCLTGDVGDEAFFMLIGPSRTGKGTFVSTLEALLGEDYAFALPVEGFLKTNNTGTLPIDVHAARGKRLITVSENEKGARFNVAKIKQWTGGDAMRGKGMRENLSNYRPTHKLLLQTNHEPKFNDNTIQERLKNIGFLVAVQEGKRDPLLKKYLRENELSGILNWALGALPGEEGLHGLADWRANRLNTPEKVRNATRDLLEAQNELKEFFDESCEFGSPDFVITNDESYLAYRRWCDARGERRFMGYKAFLAAMREQESLGISPYQFPDPPRPRGFKGVRVVPGGPAQSVGAQCERCARPATSAGRCDAHPRSSDHVDPEDLPF